MKKLLLIFVAVILAAGTNAQTEKEKRELTPFTEIEVTGAAVVTLIQGDIYAAEITARPEHLQQIETQVKNGVLRITLKKGPLTDSKVEVTFKELSKIRQSGASTVKSDGKISLESLELETSGVGVTRLNLNVKELTTVISGTGDVQYKGSAARHNLKVSGAGSLKATDLSVQHYEVNISGAADAKIDVTETLRGKISGAANIRYLQEPPVKELDITGAADVKPVKSSPASKGDTTKVRLGDTKVLIIADKDKTDTTSTAKKKKSYSRKNHWAGIDLGVAGYITPQQSFGMQFENQLFELDYARSRTWNINFMEKNFRLYRNYIGVVTGLGTSFTRYHFNNRNTMLMPFSDTTAMVPVTTNVNRKHFLSTTHLTVPLLLEFNTHKNSDKSFHLAAGVIGGYRIGSKGVRVGEINGNRTRQAISDDYNINPFSLSATVRFGYGNLNLFATYGLTELFQSGRGPQLFPVSAGLTLIGF